KGKARIDRGADVDAILDLLEKWGGELKEVNAKLEELKVRRADDPTTTLADSKRVVKLLAGADGAEKEELRERLKSRLRSLLDAIWVLPVDVDGRTRAVEAHLVFKSGKVRM